MSGSSSTSRPAAPGTLTCVLIGAEGGGGEEVFLRDLVAAPPPEVHYRPIWEHHASVVGARARRWQEIAFNRCVQPRLWPLGGLRSYAVEGDVDLVHVHNFSHRIRPGHPVVMSLGGATYWHYLTRYLGYSDQRVASLYRRAGELYRTLGVANEFVHWAPIDAIVVFSEFARGFLDRAGVPADRVHVIPPGIADPGEQPPSGFGSGDRKGLRVLLVGRDPFRKGADVAVAAVGALRSRGYDVSLTLLGDPAYEELRHEGVSGEGRIGLAELRSRRIPDADVVVVPSREEGYGLVAVEALAAGRAVIVSDTAALPEIVDDPTSLVGAGDIQGLAGAIERYLTDPPLVAQRGRRARERYERTFTLGRTRGQLRRLYDRVIEASSRRPLDRYRRPRARR